MRQGDQDNLENRLLDAAYRLGIGAQFGGKYFAHDVRVVRLPRHGASCPVGMGVSCSADRNIKARITAEGLWLEQLEPNPGRFIPERHRVIRQENVVQLDLNRPMREILAQLTKHPVTTRLSLNGTIVVARDIAHAKLKERIDRGEGLPQYFKDHPVYYAGPAKTPEGLASGSFGPTTAGRMDSYVDLFQSNGGSMVMIAKGNRSKQVTDACRKHGGFYLGSIGLYVGNFAFTYLNVAGCLRREYYDMVKYALLSPVYWAFMSVGDALGRSGVLPPVVAAWRAAANLRAPSGLSEKLTAGWPF